MPGAGGMQAANYLAGIAPKDGTVISVLVPYITLAQVLGLNLRACNQTWAHGRFTASCIQWAAMLVNAGLADAVARTLFKSRDSKAEMKVRDVEESYHSAIDAKRPSPSAGRSWDRPRPRSGLSRWMSAAWRKLNMAALRRRLVGGDPPPA